jgi:hypothetical protein
MAAMGGDGSRTKTEIQPFGRKRAGRASAFPSADDATGGLEEHDHHDRLRRLPDQGAIIGGKYRLVERLGEGMFGRVYVAERTDVPEHRVAMKIVTRAVYAGRNVERELTTLAAASHPHIVQLKDHGVEDDYVWLTMPLFHGETLAERIARGPLGLREAYDVFVPIARGVQALHERGLRHQDIKPENIFLARFSDRVHPVLLDLGVAVERNADFVAGTVIFCSPEQVMALGGVAAAAELSEKMDTYCLATTLLTALTGETSASGEPSTPLQLANLFELREREPLAEGVLPDLTGEPRRLLVEALRRWLQRDPCARADAQQMADDLDVLLEQEREAARAIEQAIVRQKSSLQRVRLALAGMAVIAAGTALYTFSKRETLRLAGELQRLRAEGADSFDKLDTCVASHELTRRRAERCATERQTEQTEHSRALAAIAAGNESAVQAVEKRNDTLRIRLRACEEDGEKTAATCAADKRGLEALLNERTTTCTGDKSKLIAERDELRRERDDARRERDDLRRERDDLKGEKIALAKLRDELARGKAQCETTLATTTEARDQCRTMLATSNEEREACTRQPPTPAAAAAAEMPPPASQAGQPASPPAP